MKPTPRGVRALDGDTADRGGSAADFGPLPTVWASRYDGRFGAERMRIASVDWWLDVRYHEKSFRGKVAIEVDGASDPLVVDAAQLTIEAATLDGRPVTFREDSVRGTLEFTGISAQPHHLEIAYRGNADPNSLVGMYVAPSGPGYVLTTMLFPTGSRRLLPSFEHPAVKTVYRLTLTVDPNVHVIFNTSPRTERPVDGRGELTYDPTPPMPAYLLYLGIGPFDTLAIPGDRWSVTVATSPGRAYAGRFSAERATELLAAYEAYYSAPYPLSKLDLVGLESFWAGAMENWGAIAFREDALLVDPTTSVRARRQVLIVLAHEIAHQWFGNLVTAAWWDDFWLNESFATFVGYRIVARLYPEEDPWTDFLLRWATPAFEEDARTASHPVHVPVDSPESLGENADAVTYGKGGAVLRMIESFLGEETFRRGVSDYLAEHQYANARSQDLWAALERASDRPVGRIMGEWIDRPGHPVIHAHWADGTLTLQQERFRADGAPSPGAWPIPLRIGSPEGEMIELFDGVERSFPLSTPRGLRIDPGRTAFARIHYDDALFASLAREFPSMTPLDQWGFVMDTHAFVYAQLAPLDRFLELVRAGGALEHDLPVRAMVDALSDLYGALYDEPLFAATVQQFLRTQLDRVGLVPLPDAPESHAVLREVLAGHLARIDPSFARELAPRFADFDQLPAELRGPVARCYAITEGPKAFAPLLARLRTTGRQSERVQMVQALGAFTDPALARQALSLITSSDVKPAVGVQLMVSTSMNPSTRRELFDWYREHAETLSDLWAGTPLHSICLRAIVPMMGIDQESEVNTYFGARTPSDARQAVEQGLESLRLVMRLRRSARAARAA